MSNVRKQLTKWDERIGALNQKDPCFVGGTLVLTQDGARPIEKVRVGDFVLTFPDDQAPPAERRQDHQFTYRRVARTLVHDDELLSLVTVFDLAAGIKETLRVTGNHPFSVEGTGWLPVSELHFGMPLANAVFGNLLLSKVKHGVERARVYNIEVEECHTYYVGTLGTWVHNKGRPSDRSRPSP